LLKTTTGVQASPPSYASSQMTTVCLAQVHLVYLIVPSLNFNGVHLYARTIHVISVKFASALHIPQNDLCNDILLTNMLHYVQPEQTWQETCRNKKHVQRNQSNSTKLISLTYCQSAQSIIECH